MNSAPFCRAFSLPFALAFGLLCCLLALTAVAQNTPLTTPVQQASPVKWEVSFSPEWKSKSERILVFKATIEKGYHVFSAKTPKNGGYFQTRITLGPDAKGYKIINEVKENGKLISTYDKVMEDTLCYYKNEVTFAVELLMDHSVVKRRAVGEITYQYCTDEEGVCVAETVPFNIVPEGQLE